MPFENETWPVSVIQSLKNVRQVNYGCKNSDNFSARTYKVGTPIDHNTLCFSGENITQEGNFCMEKYLKEIHFSNQF